MFNWPGSSTTARSINDLKFSVVGFVVLSRYNVSNGWTLWKTTLQIDDFPDLQMVSMHFHGTNIYTINEANFTALAMNSYWKTVYTSIWQKVIPKPQLFVQHDFLFISCKRILSLPSLYCSKFAPTYLRNPIRSMVTGVCTPGASMILSIFLKAELSFDWMYIHSLPTWYGLTLGPKLGPFQSVSVFSFCSFRGTIFSALSFFYFFILFFVWTFFSSCTAWSFAIELGMLSRLS